MVDIQGLVKSVVLGFVALLIGLKLAVVLVPTLAPDLTSLQNTSNFGGLWSLFSSSIISDLLIPAGLIIVVIYIAMNMYKGQSQ